MFFKKKSSPDPINISILPEDICKIIHLKASEVSFDQPFTVDPDVICCLFRDGNQVKLPDTGCIYPFSDDLSCEGSAKQMKKYQKVTFYCVTQRTFPVYWGTRENSLIQDPQSGETYQVEARGMLYMSVDPDNAKTFFSCLVPPDARDASPEFEHLNPIIANEMLAAISEHIEKKEIDLSAVETLSSRDHYAIAQAACERLTGALAQCGLIFQREASRSTALGGTMFRSV